MSEVSKPKHCTSCTRAPALQEYHLCKASLCLCIHRMGFPQVLRFPPLGELKTLNCLYCKCEWLAICMWNWWPFLNVTSVMPNVDQCRHQHCRTPWKVILIWKGIRWMDGWTVEPSFWVFKVREFNKSSLCLNDFLRGSCEDEGNNTRNWDHGHGW